MATNVDKYFNNNSFAIPFVVTDPIDKLAKFMDTIIPDNDEKSAGMRKLLEARDCFIRAYKN